MSQPDETTFPRRFGEYVLVTHLGEGGMGRVYLALRRVRGRSELCVIKRFGNPRSRFSAVEVAENRKRFRREAEITMALEHSGIARTLSYSEDAGNPYLVQEFVRGSTLESCLGVLSGYREHLPVPLAAYVVAKISEALAYVHEFRGLGLVHRDLTASNVMFSLAGEVKIIDFGIAKPTLSDDPNFTRPNIIVGKPLWTAPELFDGRKADCRADVFALGLLFWFLLAGRSPEPELAEEVPLPRPSRINPEVPHLADQIIGKVLSAAPDERFQTALEFRDAVLQLVPENYPGQDTLAALLARNETAFHQRSFDELVASARPLLGERVSPWSRHWKAGALVLTLVAVGIALGVLRRTTVPHVSRSPGPLVPTRVAPPPSPPAPPLAAVPPPSPPVSPELTEPSPDVSPEVPAPKRRAIASAGPRPAQPQSPTQGPAADDLLDDAILALSRGDTSRALSLATASNAARPTAKASILIARLVLEADPTAARAALESALRLEPGNTEAKKLLSMLGQLSP